MWVNDDEPVVILGLVLNQPDCIASHSIKIRLGPQNAISIYLVFWYVVALLTLATGEYKIYQGSRY